MLAHFSKAFIFLIPSDFCLYIKSFVTYPTIIYNFCKLLVNHVDFKLNKSKWNAHFQKVNERELFVPGNNNPHAWMTITSKSDKIICIFTWKHQEKKYVEIIHLNLPFYTELRSTSWPENCNSCQYGFHRDYCLLLVRQSHRHVYSREGEPRFLF